jgi:hypothetical protein
MKKIVSLLSLVILTCFLSLTSFSQSAEDCLILHEGTFTYQGEETPVKVVIKEKEHTEYHNDGKYVIKSKLEWVSDCEYNMTMTKVTIPDFPFKPGDVMNVKINRVEGNDIYYTSTVKGLSWEGKLTKVK